VRRPITAAVLVTVVATGLALTGTACSAPGPAPSSADDLQTVARAADAIGDSPSHQTVTTSTTVGVVIVDGDTDPVAKNFSIRVSGPATSEVRTIGDDAWVTVTGQPKKWAHLDVTKLPETSPTRATLDLRSTYAVLYGITSAHQSAPGTYECVADLNKAKAAMPTPTRQADVQALIDLAGAGAAAVPFRATLDEKHRLVELSYDIGSGKPAQLTFNAVITSYGQPFTVVKPPAADVMEGTPDMYGRY
jgi:hypothetical protein